MIQAVGAAAGRATGRVAGRIRGPRLIFWSMIVASLALSVGSFYTTWIGMMEFVGSDTIGVAISFIITFGVQSLLYAISWGIAQNWRLGGTRLISSALMWLICAFISGFFSFYGFFNEQGGRDLLTRHLYINTAIQTTVQGIADDLAKRVEDRHRAMIESDEYARWMNGGIEKVISDSQQLESAISQTARLETNRLRNQIQDNRLEIARLRGERERTTRNLSNSQSDIDNVRADVKQLEDDVARLSREIPNLADELTSLGIRKEQEARTGTGPRFRALELDENTTRAALESARQELALKQDRLADRRTDLEDMEAILRAGGVQSVVTAFNTEIEKLDAESREFQDDIEKLEARRAFDANSEITRVEAIRREFENKNYDRYSTLVDNCIDLENVIKDHRPAGATSVDCRSPYVVQSINELRQLEADVVRFRAECLDTLPSVEDNKLDPLIEAATECLPMQPDARKRSEAFLTMTELKSKRGDDANPISAAGVALFEDQQANAVLALILAISVDLLVLICAIIGRHSGDSERVRAIDLLFDHARKYDDDGFEYLVSMPQDSNQRAIVSELINMLLRENLAEFRDPTGETIALRPGARERLILERAKESGDYHRPREPARHPPSPAAEPAPPPPEDRQPIRRGRFRGDP